MTKANAKDEVSDLPSEHKDGKSLERLTDLTRRIVAVPREKIEEQECAYQKQRANKVGS